MGVSHRVPRSVLFSAVLILTVVMQGQPAAALVQASVTTGTLDAATTQTGRLLRDGTASKCSAPKVVPTITAATGARAYDAYTFTNGPTAACVEVALTATAGAIGSAWPVVYSPSYDPANIQTNYLADTGFSAFTGNTVTMAFSVPASTTFVVVVQEVEIGTGVGMQYRLVVHGLRPAVDFDANSASDRSVFRPSTGHWFVRDGSPEVTQYGVAGDVAVPGDYNGDGTVDKAIYRPSTGQWFVRNASPIPEVTQYGIPCPSACQDNADTPVPADYNGDGRVDIAIYRKSTGQWFIRNAAPVPEITQYGLPCTGGCTQSSEIPVPADFDGNGTADIAVYRRTTGQWFVKGGLEGISYGTPGANDVPVPSDFSGDGLADIAVYRPGTGQWLRRGLAPEVVQYGMPGTDVPLIADFTASNQLGDDTAVYRTTTGQWLTKPGSASNEVVQYGAAGDIPLALPYPIRIFMGFTN